jgi:hypothetical protein
MKRDKLVPFALGFIAGVLFMLLTGGTVGGVLTFTMRQRVLAAEQEALSQRKLAEEQAQEARQQELRVRQQAEDARREADRLREKP